MPYIERRAAQRRIGLAVVLAIALWLGCMLASATAASAATNWTQPQTVTGDGGGYNEMLTVDPQGDVTEASRNAKDGTIIATTFNGDDWQPTDTLGYPGNSLDAEASAPFVATGPDGQAVALWQSCDDNAQDPCGLYLRYRPAGSSQWGAAETVALWATYGFIGNNDSSPVAGFDSQGRPVIAWVASAYGEAAEPRLLTATRLSQGTFSTPTEIVHYHAFSDDRSTIRYLRVASDRAGHVALAWKRQYASAPDGSTSQGDQIEVASLKGDGSWQRTDLTDSRDYPTGDSGPRLTMDGNGHATVLWQPFDGSDTPLPYVMRQQGSDGSWGNIIDLPDDTANTGGDYFTPPPVVAAEDAAGDVTAAWASPTDSTSTDYRVRAATRPAGGTWSAPEDLSVANTTDQAPTVDSPQIATNPQGDVVVGWLESAVKENLDPVAYVQTAYRPHGGSFEQQKTLYTDYGAGNPQVVIDDQGVATAMWETVPSSGWAQLTASRSAPTLHHNPPTVTSDGSAAGDGSGNDTDTAETLIGHVTTNKCTLTDAGDGTYWRFEYEPSSTFDGSHYTHATSYQFAGGQVTAQSVFLTLHGLQPDTAYHWRLAAKNVCSGTTAYANGQDQTFSTATTPPVDTTPPTIHISTPNNDDFPGGITVGASYTCSDAESGVASCTGDVPNGQALDTCSPGVYSFHVTATDHAGNTATETTSYRIEPTSAGTCHVDQTLPTLTITSPLDGQHITQGTRSLAGFHCRDEDGGSGIGLCQGDVDDGAPLDTSSIGPHVFHAVAIDKAGNTRRGQVTYYVDAPPPDPDAGKTGQDRVHEAGSEAGQLPGSLPSTGGIVNIGADAPNNTILQGTVKLPDGASLISDKGLGLISDKGLGIISTGGGSILSTGGASIINSNNAGIINSNNAGVLSPGNGSKIAAKRASASFLPKPAKKCKPTKKHKCLKQVLLFQAGHRFTAAGKAKLTLRLTKQGRKLLKSYKATATRLKRHHHKVRPIKIAVFTVVGPFKPGNGPAGYTERLITIKP